ncbi:iron-sulfur protein [Streptomyces sp. SID4919]|uniref:(2Fe-2S)-binding protein n=1 Tax=unclassified Streptomyces TaxID=2593676 RepID=UPI000823ABAC|nr:(2Fe-2S)-binding protein [Streptomyces sp. AmelKG-E11A]MYY09294.1 iron-sulfur protein [Streptomyces sp. SID4919]SCK42516.1 FhuF 2Fe-2S C-terminal domain-containing protein [Streptomyces sp. AmelKG-E11A]
MFLAPASAPPAPAVSCSALLTATYQRLIAYCPALDVHTAEPSARVRQGWFDGAELACREDFLHAWLDNHAAGVRLRYDHEARPDVVASRALHGYLWTAALLISGPWYLERRVPRVRPADLRISRTSDRYEIVPGGFSCLPGDPAAGLPGVRVLPDEESLRAELRAALADHVRPLLAATGPRVRRGPRALWGMVSDDLVSAIWYLGRMLDEEDRGVREADAVLPGAVSPYPGGAAFRTLTSADGRTHPTRTRLGCCLYYTIRPAEACATCPRTSDEERLRRTAAS